MFNKPCSIRAGKKAAIPVSRANKNQTDENLYFAIRNHTYTIRTGNEETNKIINKTHEPDITIYSILTNIYIG